MTPHEAWVLAALMARRDQGLPPGPEDVDACAAVAALLTATTTTEGRHP